VTPGEYDRRVANWRRIEAKKRTKKMEEDSKAQRLRDEISQGIHRWNASFIAQ
jgi:hypothetical protein